MKKRIISLLLGIISLCTFAFGCKQEAESNSGTGEAREKYTYTDGVHDLTAPETNEFMVENGKCDYKILLPSNLDSNLILAESELKYFFEEATGVKLSTVVETEEGISHTADGKYISIGDTKMLESSGVDLDKSALKTQGLRIVTKDKTVYIFGSTTNGALNGVYTLLTLLFDYDQFSYNCHNLKEMNSVKLRNFNVTDVPDIDMRGCSSRLTENNPNNLQYRLRTHSWSEYFIPLGDTENGEILQTVHNTSNVLPRGAATSRENWYSDQSGQGGDNTQLCYTAHGDEEDYEAMIDRIVYVLSRSLIKYSPDKYPLRNIMAFTHEDNSNTMCRCDWCVEATAKYGAQSALALLVANDVRAGLEEWMNLPENAEYKRDDLKLVFFAYAAFVDAPAHYDEEQGKYVINHPDLQMRDDVGVFYAISSGFSYQQDFYDEASAEGIENSLKWFDIASSVYLWTYDANFGNFLFRTAGTNFYDTDAYQFFARGGAAFMFKQATMPGANVTSFQMLDIYLDAKMQWDTTQDINELTQKWFKGMFKDAADVMFKLYTEQNTWALIIAYETRKITQTGIINYSVGREYWKYEMLKGWLDMIDEARALTEKYKEVDSNLYYLLKENIDVEWVCPAYYMLAYNAESLSDATYNQMVRYFQTDIAALKDFQFSEKSMTTIGTWSAALTLRNA